MSTLSKLIGKRIKEIRESKKLKQIDLANLIEIEATNLSKIEKGIHLPKEENLNKITAALDIEIKDLFDFKHLKSKDELLRKINYILNDSKQEELQFFYRFLTAYREM